MPERSAKVPAGKAYLEYMASSGDLERILRAMKQAEWSAFHRGFADGVAPWRGGDSLVVPSHVLVCFATV